MEVVEIECDLLEQVNNVATLGECFTWMQRCDECIERFEERSRAKFPRLSIGNRQSLVVRIVRLEDAKIQLQRRFIHFGGDYTGTNSSDAERFVWQEIDAAFESHVITGAVINFKHIEPPIPRRCERNCARACAKRHAKIKTVFNGEFVAGDKRTNKSITTKKL